MRRLRITITITLALILGGPFLTTLPLAPTLAAPESTSELALISDFSATPQSSPDQVCLEGEGCFSHYNGGRSLAADVLLDSRDADFPASTGGLSNPMAEVIIIDDGCPYEDPQGFERRAPPEVDAWICISAQNPVYWAYGHNDALYVRTNANPVEWVKWRPTIAIAARYKVEVSIPSYHSNVPKTRQARYTVHHANGDTVIHPLDQGAEAGNWYNLGTFRFNAGTGGYVYLESYTTENPWQLLAADAARFTLVNQPPNVPNLTSPANGSSTANSNVTLCLQDTGDPDNYPRNYRDYYFRIENTDGSWSQEQGWTTDTCWTVAVPSAGTYRWRAQSGDGELPSGWTDWWAFSYSEPPSSILEVPYADQVYVQQTPECFPHGCFWNHCGPASVAMILSYYNKVGDVLYDRQPTLDLVPRVKPNGSGAAVKGLMERTFQEEGLQVRSEQHPSFADIEQNIQNGHPVLLSVSGRNHVLVVVGFEDNDTVIVNDPYGGKAWWDDYTQKNSWNGGWIYYPPNPQLKGRGVEYRYGTEISGWYGIFITGLAPEPQTTQATVSTTQSTTLVAPEWLSQAVEILFPPWEGSTQLQGNAETLTVTYTPQFTPTQQTEGFGSALASFRLDASDTNDQPVQQFSSPFTLTVNLDPSIVDSLGIASGSTRAEEEDSSTSPITDTQALDWSLALAYWDKGQQCWTTVPATVNIANHQIVARSDQFTEFAVFTQYQHRVYLPLILR